MKLLQYWKVLQKNLWLILLTVVVGVGATAFYTIEQPPAYESSTTLLLNPSVPTTIFSVVGNQVTANLADNYTELIHTRSFAQSVVKDLPFPLSPDALVAAVQTELVRNTFFYQITTRADSPQHAQQLAQSLVKVFFSTIAAQQAGPASGPAATREQNRQVLATRLTYVTDQITNYQNQIQQLQAQPASKARDDQLLQLEGTVATLTQTEATTMATLNQLGASGADANSAQVIDQPLPGVQVRRLPLNLALALLVSLLLGAGAAFIREYLDYSIHSLDQLEQLLGVVPLAAIGVIGAAGSQAYPYTRRGKPRDSDAPVKLAGHNLVTIERPKSPEAESFRVLRTNIQFSSVEKPIHSLVVTSSAPGEGKSFTSANLAVSMAQDGKQVILVDCDLRKPSVHTLFELPNTTGFTNLLLNDTLDLDEVAHVVPGVPNLRVISSGPMPPNPAELLNTPRAAQVLAQLGQHADLVICDAPPAGAVTDPVLLATRVDAVILVVNMGTTRRDMVVRVQQSLRKVGVRALLPVLNRVKACDMGGYYYYNYYSSETPRTPTNGNGHSAAAEIPATALAVKAEGPPPPAPPGRAGEGR